MMLNLDSKPRPECLIAETKARNSRPNFWRRGQSGLEALTSLITRTALFNKAIYHLIYQKKPNVD